MNAFEKVEQRHSEYTMAQRALRAAREEATGITNAVKSRLATARATDLSRIEQLEKLVNDPTSTETARYVGNLELKHLKAATYVPTDEENAAFEEAIARAEAALSDMKKGRESFKAAFTTAKGEMDAMRTDVMKDLFELPPRWIESDRLAFEKLSKEVTQ